MRVSRDLVRGAPVVLAQGDIVEAARVVEVPHCLYALGILGVPHGPYVFDILEVLRVVGPVPVTIIVGPRGGVGDESALEPVGLSPGGRSDIWARSRPREPFLTLGIGDP